jgi:hypothetical protein
VCADSTRVGSERWSAGEVDGRGPWEIGDVKSSNGGAIRTHLIERGRYGGGGGKRG